MIAAPASCGMIFGTPLVTHRTIMSLPQCRGAGANPAALKKVPSTETYAIKAARGEEAQLDEM